MISKELEDRLTKLENKQGLNKIHVITFGNGIGLTKDEAVKKYETENNIQITDKSKLLFVEVPTDKEIQTSLIDKKNATEEIS